MNISISPRILARQPTVTPEEQIVENIWQHGGAYRTHRGHENRYPGVQDRIRRIEVRRSHGMPLHTRDALRQNADTLVTVATLGVLAVGLGVGIANGVVELAELRNGANQVEGEVPPALPEDASEFKMEFSPRP